MSTLSENPVLFLAIDNLSKMSSIDEKQLSTIWNLFTKCKDNLENGRRLENISWRLWYRSTHFPIPAVEKNSTQMSTSFSQVLSAPFDKTRVETALPLAERTDLSMQSQAHLELHLASSLEPKLEPTGELTGEPKDSIVVENFMQNQKILLEEIADQDIIIQEHAKEISSCPGDYHVGKRATFFVSDSESVSIEMKRDCVKQDDDTDYYQTDDDDGFSYSTDWSWTPSPLFHKIPLKDLKQPIVILATLKKSQLSSALHTKNQVKEDSGEIIHNRLSSSMNETLRWDRCMPFNTKYAKDRPINEDWRGDDTAEYW